ncbi:ATP-binding protein [Desulfopila aestuarii]|uniref:histidine kinase n=1 Tax=Desulfopila aestuarii DSM 18488 TaxID=1121416 RepID=A0A1M7YAV3_9BACT|nr:ATP-binding protein [Desulfopila aestuarii]SHO49743.1 His Kinase A (phospho-acceptor) domain-containing protein [Desulfopila aestuarii DSM 18488]
MSRIFTLRPSITTKLFVLCLFVILAFSAIIWTMISAFRTVDSLSNTIIERDVSRIIQNGQLVRDLTRILTETNLVVSSFYGQDVVLVTKEKELATMTLTILGRDMDEEQGKVLLKFRSSLSSLLEQCKKINSLKRSILNVDKNLHTTLNALEESVAGKIVNLVLAGEDSMALEQLGALIPSYRDVVLQIALRFTSLDPVQDGNQDVFPITELLDTLHLRFRTLLASEADVATYGKKLLVETVAYRKLVIVFAAEVVTLHTRLSELKGIQEQTLAVMQSVDEQSANGAQTIQTAIRQSISSSVNSMVLLAALVAIVILTIIYTFLLLHIRRPMAAILQGIASVSEGNLQTVISMGRKDEWDVIERALNRMTLELGESYERLQNNNVELTRAHNEMEKHMWALESEMSQRKMAEAENAKLQQQLQHAQKMEAIGTLAGGVAHDFNNLLQGIQGYTELLLLKSGKDESRELHQVLRAAQRGGELTRQLLTFSRKMESKLCPVNINQIIGDMRVLLERTIPKMIQVQLHLNANLRQVNGDGAQLEQVLMNLAVNARDAMPDGGVLTISTEEIAFPDHEGKILPEMVPGPYVVLRVADTGVGMDQETRERIFNPFFTTKEVGRGTGLGLAMVYGIVKNHQGHIVCDSEPGKGTAFIIYLPAIDLLPDQAKIDPATDLPGGVETLLLVDDEPYIRELGQKILTQFGYTVICAESGEMALRIAEEQREQIQLVILDIIMPGMGGEQCMKWLLADFPSLKVIIASGYSDIATQENVLRDGLTFINKPYNVGEMLRIVRKVLDT